MSKHFSLKCTFVHLFSFAVIILLCLPIMSVKAVPSQTSTVSGVVISGTDELPLVGVSVLVKETANGTITDMDGNFKLNVVSGQTLVFSYRIRYAGNRCDGSEIAQCNIKGRYRNS